jgi:cation diffusion facilitator CzcD-associated flavoprotein CzcO
VFRLPGVWRLNRLRLYLRQERREVGGAFFRPGSRSNTKARAMALRHIADVFADHPELQEAVTPRYPFGGKRAVLSSQFFASLLRPDVELVPHAVAACTPTSVIDTAGVEREVDALVMATGFHAASYLSTLEVVGRDGARLHDVWDGEPSAFLGITVPRFPNFFMLDGPNTNGGLIMFNLERQAEYAAREITRLRRSGIEAVEVRADVTRAYNTWLQRKIARTSFTSTDNYYTSPTGTVVTQWPDCETLYAILTRLLRGVSTLGRRTGRRPLDDPPGSITTAQHSGAVPERSA